MIVTILKWVIVVVAIMNFGFMTFDGSRGLIVGDYVRPETGEYAGQLGPWADVVQEVGIDPEGDFMKTTFLIWGIVGLVIAVSLAMDVENSTAYLLVLSIFSLWYLVPGTVLSIIQIVLLLIRKRLLATPQ